MSITVCPFFDDFAAEICDVDLSKPLDESLAESLKQALWTYGVVVFPDQVLAQNEHVQFASIFGPLESTILKNAVSDVPLRVREDIADVSNLDHRNEIWGADSRLRGLQLGNRMWHTDSSFKHTPALCSLLYAREIPPVGGQTEFADMRAAYDALDEADKQLLEGRVARHSLMYSRARMGYKDWTEEEKRAVAPVPQVMVRTIPETGRKNLYVASHAGEVLGMDDAQGQALIDRLLEHASQRQFVYSHRWRVNDLVVWDNRRCLHRGLAFDDLRFRRDMQRATVADVANTCEQEHIEVDPANVA
jgi:alpha-ketoglutarate-dependent 2,4-dichlorophenoxyacetate dioxygenase